MAIEESQRERDVKHHCDFARAVLPGIPTRVEVALLHMLNAIEASVADEPSRKLFYGIDLGIPVDEDEYGPGQLESLITRVQGSEKKFIISFPQVELGEKDIWPDGEGPDDPTPDDVIEVMRGWHDEEDDEDDDTAVPGRIAVGWLLIEKLFVAEANDPSRSAEEWDGT